MELIRRIQKQRPQLIAGAYISVFVLIILAIWNPKIPLGAGPVDLLLLLDESDSISAEHNNTVWQIFLRHSLSLPAGSRISLIRFADRARVEIPWISVQDISRAELAENEPPPRHRFLDSGASSIASALKTAIEFSSAERHTAILLSSDAVDSVTPDQITPALKNKNPKLSLFYLKAENRYQKSTFSIESVNLPSVSTSAHSLPLSVAVKSNSGGQGSIEILVNGHSSAKHHLALQAGEIKVINHRVITDSSYKKTIKFIIRDEYANTIDEQKHIVTHSNNKKLLYIGHNSFKPYSQYLQQEAWQIIKMQPQDLPSDATFFNKMDVVLMDNLPAAALSNHITKNLINAVEQSGTGLIVIGGPDSFGSGGYRHSELEKILPVISEASRPLPAAAFLFLLDKSGSMDAKNRNASRLADAMRAVRESSKSLRSGDESALLVFDKSVEVLLPLKHRVDTASALNQSWQLQASGGTQLKPALEKSIEILTTSDAKQRFLLLVSDGFVDADKLPALKIMLQQTAIQIIALAIGNNADITTLQKLTAINNGRVLKVSQSAQLPRLMRQELETKQQSWNKQSVTPISLNQTPFFKKQTEQWHDIQGYQLTRPKSSASVYLTTNKGDPLLAIQHFGAARVAALPGGILSSLSGENMLSQLVTWLNSHQQNPYLNVSHRYLAQKLIIQVDAIDVDSQWHQASSGKIILTYPGNINHSQTMELIAPGRFTTSVDAPVSGFYSAKITIADQQTVYNTYLAADRERRHLNIAPWLKNALTDNSFHYWDESSLKELRHNSSGLYAIRTLCLLLALLCFLAVIAFERYAGLQAYIRNTLNSKFISRFRKKPHE